MSYIFILGNRKGQHNFFNFAVLVSEFVNYTTDRDGPNAYGV